MATLRWQRGEVRKELPIGGIDGRIGEETSIDGFSNIFNLSDLFVKESWWRWFIDGSSLISNWEKCSQIRTLQCNCCCQASYLENIQDAKILRNGRGTFRVVCPTNKEQWSMWFLSLEQVFVSIDQGSESPAMIWARSSSWNDVSPEYLDIQLVRGKKNR